MPNCAYEIGKIGNVPHVNAWHLASKPQGYDNWVILIGQGTYYNPMLIRNRRKTRIEGCTTDIIAHRA